MIISKKSFYISPEDYLEGERVSPIKHEYRRGQVYAMTGAKKAHVIIALNFASILRSHLFNTSCCVFIADMKLRIESADCYYYPDITVTCDQRDTTSTEDFILYPSLVIEVLSKSTAAFDKGDKFADYQTLSSLREYVLVSQTEMNVQSFYLDDSGVWVSQIYRHGDEVYLSSIDFHGAISDIYHKVPGVVL